MLIDNEHSINSLKVFYRSLMSQFHTSDGDVWIFITRAHLLLSYADRLRQIGKCAPKSAAHLDLFATLLT